jgi:hypothetical protein
MATRNETHVHDLSTVANFKDWGQAVNTALTAFGWTQTADTGQVNWTTISSVPTSGNYVTELWQPGDGGTPFYIRIDYGNNAGNQPAMRFQGGTSTTGTGALSGFTTTLIQMASAVNTGSTLYNCLFSGDSSSFNIMMWRDASAANFVLSVDRARTSAGATTNAYFSILSFRATNVSGAAGTCQSVVFGIGVAPQLSSLATGSLPTLATGTSWAGVNQSMFFNGNYGFIPVFPYVGYFDVPSLALGQLDQLDFSELSVLSLTILGSVHTYIVSKLSNFSFSNNFCLAMRWE